MSLMRLYIFIRSQLSVVFKQLNTVNSAFWASIDELSYTRVVGVFQVIFAFAIIYVELSLVVDGSEFKTTTTSIADLVDLHWQTIPLILLMCGLILQGNLVRFWLKLLLTLPLFAYGAFLLYFSLTSTVIIAGLLNATTTLGTWAVIGLGLRKSLGEANRTEMVAHAVAKTEQVEHFSNYVLTRIPHKQLLEIANDYRQKQGVQHGGRFTTERTG